MKLTKQKLTSLIEEVLQERESDKVRINVINKLIKDFLNVENFEVYNYKKETYLFRMKKDRVISFVEWVLGSKKNLEKFFTLIPRLEKLPRASEVLDDEMDQTLEASLAKLAKEASFRIHSEDSWIKNFPDKKDSVGFYSPKMGIHLRGPYGNFIFKSLGEKQVFNIVKNIKQVNSTYVHEYAHAIQHIQGMKTGDYHNREWQNRPQEVDARFYQGLQDLINMLQNEGAARRIFKMIDRSRQEFLDWFVSFGASRRPLESHDEKSQRRMYNRSYDILVMIEKMPEFQQWKEDQKNRGALKKLVDSVVDWFYEEEGL